jgi:hypothetical protein
MNDYKSGLLRPYFTNFVNAIKTRFKDKIHLFIYTASNKEWANYIIPIIESLIKFKFERPLFTRDNCSMDNVKIKSLQNVEKQIYSSLKLNIRQEALKNHIFLIDNNYVFEDRPFLIKCPSYEYTVFVNILRSVPDRDLETNHKKALRLIINDEKKDSSSKLETLKIIYDDAFKKYIYYDQRNDTKKYSEDDYWKKVTRCLMKQSTNIKKAINDLKHIH